MWVYQKTKGVEGLWTVGFYTPDARWISESDHDSEEDCRWRVHFLNGGSRIKEQEVTNAYV
jgi:hypothetical protein